MKKYAWIAISSFTLGLLLAGYLFLYLPEKNAAPADVFVSGTAPAPSANLFASPPSVTGTDRPFVSSA